MSTWDPTRYLQFADHRSRPFVELIARVDSAPRSIVDLGCGPGHLTSVLHGRWPEAMVRGVDSSPEMIDRAQVDHADPRATYELADVATWSTDSNVDLIVSNALFQWIPDQLDVIRRLADAVSAGGAFAVQVPNNYAAPSHQLLHEISARSPWREHTEGLHADRGNGPDAYLELFTDLGWNVDAWETTYLQVLPGPDAVWDWISGTGARPIVQALPDGLREEFVEEYKAALRDAYPPQSWGTVLPFTRTFCVATRPA